MQQIDTLISARWVIPIEPADTVLENYSIAVHDGLILELLPNSKAIEKYQATHTFNLDEHTVMPGLINTHTHAAMSLMRGIADDLPLKEWLEEHIWPAEQKLVTESFVREGGELAIAEMLRSGTTCFSDMYFFPDATAKAAIDTGIRAVIGLIVLDFPTAWGENADEYLEKGVALHDSCRNSPHIHTAFAPHAPYTVSDGPLEKIQMLAEELDIPIHIHLHETAHEIDESLELYGERPIQRLWKLGLLGPRLIAVHMTQLTDEEIELLAEHSVNIVHCPESNMKLASGFCPVNKLIKAGVNVALGTDGAASNNDLDMLGEMKTAALLTKGVSGDPTALSAHSALEMATINGARSLGIDEITGSLVAGKAADIIAINLSALESRPLYNVASHIVYATNRHQVEEVWVNGKHLLRNRELITLDKEKVKQQAYNWQVKIDH
ncbi:MAG: TRZ/ATZ family hydrolase [Thiotrichales bacterium]|nr:TRZ/ATZ family hydrolase [Thiotrichales bacterium]MBT3613992.1 TRZ/ATZ family hydrolase [Thiotrichales bacterium]MBT3752087.1 TRZ/ATZ family hydrolase [Thiotrichales bacterium]MBT3836801.1 TRZ/ATZ family hydrolase [Thiotrichales bacterium]MBT4151575.1 TRZ/ATZ family hydrolase [Thiotrichales bacterium]